MGVVAAITPFNFPAMIPLWFLPYAIACGNTFILKPSEQDPLPAQRIFELAAEVAEIPPGVINLVHGAHDAVNAILDHPGIDGISFVGSAATARYIASRASANGKRVQALGGAKNAMVIMPDADPELTAKGVTSSAFGAAGQRCLAGSVAVLVGSRVEQDRSLRLIMGASERLKYDPGSDPETDVCPVISPEARERLVQEITAASHDTDGPPDCRAKDGSAVVLDHEDCSFWTALDTEECSISVSFRYLDHFASLAVEPVLIGLVNLGRHRVAASMPCAFHLVDLHSHAVSLSS